MLGRAQYLRKFFPPARGVCNKKLSDKVIDPFLQRPNPLPDMPTPLPLSKEDLVQVELAAQHTRVHSNGATWLQGGFTNKSPCYPESRPRRR